MSLHKMLRAAAGYQAPAPANTDPQFNYVSMLLHGDGTNGAQNNTFVDSSTNNFTITRNGNTTQGSLSPYGNLWSNYFDGNGDYVAGASSTALALPGAFTFECWFYPNSFDQVSVIGDTIFSCIAVGSLTIARTSSTAGNAWGIAETGVAWRLTSTTLPTNNAWNHLVAVRDASNNAALFLNGVRVASGTITTSFGQNGFSLGSDNGSASSFLDGYLSNVRLVKGTAVYNPTSTTLTVPTAPLTAISGTSLLTCQSNRFIDNSSNNFTITRNGDVRVTKESPFLPTAAYSTSTIGGSGYFDGSGDYLSLTSNSAFDFGTGNFTIEFWFYSTVNSASYGGFVVRGTERYVVCMNGSGNAPQMWVDAYSVSAPICQSTTNICDGAWHHIAAVRNGNVFSIYVDGIAGGTSNTWTGSIVSSTAPMWIGADPDNTSGTITGYMSNVRVVKGTALYTSNFTPPTAPLTAITNTSLLLKFTNAGIFDNAAENNLETVGNAQISTSVKKYGTGSIAFDGTGDWLLVPDGVNLRIGTGNFTVEAWVYLSATGSARGLVGKGTSTTGWLLSTNSSDQVVFTYGSTTLTSSSALSANTWTHVAVVREGTGTNQTKIYIGGSLVATGTVATDFNQTNPMYIGADRTGGSALNGYIDDLRITKGFARYTAAFTPPTAAFPDQ